MNPVTISDEDWNKLCYPRPKYINGHREGVPEHMAAPLPSPEQKWTVCYKVYSEVIAPNYQEAIKAAEKLTGYSKDYLMIEMGEKQPGYPPPILHGNNQSESPIRLLERRTIQKRQIQRSKKASAKKVSARKNHKSR